MYDKRTSIKEFRKCQMKGVISEDFDIEEFQYIKDRQRGSNHTSGNFHTNTREAVIAHYSGMLVDGVPGDYNPEKIKLWESFSDTDLRNASQIYQYVDSEDNDQLYSDPFNK